MATITATKAGNWSDTTVWDLGRIPEAGDDVALAGYVIVWDTAQTRIPATGTLTSISSTGKAGQISLALDDAAFHGGASIYATTITAGTKPATSGIILISGTTDHIITITTGTEAGQGVFGGAGSTANTYGINHNSTGTLNFIGRSTGGNLTNNEGIYSNVAGIINVTGNLYGNPMGYQSRGLYNNNGTVNVTGNIYGGSGTGLLQYGLWNVSGTVTIDGIINGGTGVGDGYGIMNSAGNVTLSANTTLINNVAVAYAGKTPAWQPASTSYAKFYVGASFGQAANTEFPQVLAAENIKSGVTSGSVVGTYTGAGGSPRFGGRSGGK